MFSSTQTDEQTLAQAQEAAARAGRQFPRPSLSPTHVAATGTGTGPLLSSHHLSIIGSSLSLPLSLCLSAASASIVPSDPAVPTATAASTCRRPCSELTALALSPQRRNTPQRHRLTPPPRDAET